MGKMTNGWNFSKQDGFSGSCGGTAVKGYMRGGHVKKPQQTAAPMKHPEPRGAKATHKGGATTPHPFAKGGKVVREVEHKDYEEYSAPRDNPVYPEVSENGRPAGYAKGGKFIAKAIKHPGALHRELHVPMGKKIPAKKLEKAEHAKGKKGERARFAATLKTMHRANGGTVQSTLKDPHAAEPYESRRGGPVKRAMGGLSRPPGPVIGARRRMGKTPPMVNSARMSPLASATPMAPRMGGMPGLKRGGRSC